LLKFLNLNKNPFLNNEKKITGWQILPNGTKKRKKKNPYGVKFGNNRIPVAAARLAALAGLATGYKK
jgi:hypothetical protein